MTSIYSKTKGFWKNINEKPYRNTQRHMSDIKTYSDLICMFSNSGKVALILYILYRKGTAGA